MSTLTKLRPWAHNTMTEPDDRINPEWTVGDLLEAFEGREFKALDPSKAHFLCDFCSKGVPYTRDVQLAGYVADGILNTDHPKWQTVLRQNEGIRPIVPLATYCDDCRSRLLFFPCEGYGEVRYLFRLTDDRVIHDVDVTDVSPRDDGIPWDPKELSEAVTQVPFDQMSIISEILRDEMWGPENTVTFFLSVTNVDPRDLIKWDGSFDPRLLGQARRQWESFRDKMTKGGYDRSEFRDHVRGE